MERYEQGEFDLILMDVQMPEMDGLQATAEIRARESGSGRHVPIVAMTAHAMKGDRERCLDAGMDGYIVKPIRRTELLEEIARRRDAISAAARAPAPGGAGLSSAGVLEICGNDPGLAAEMCKLYVEESAGLMRALGDAVLAGNAAAVKRAAHKLKSSTQIFDRGTARTVLELESMGRQSELGGSATVFAKLVTQMKPLREAVCQMAARLEPAQSVVKRGG